MFYGRHSIQNDDVAAVVRVLRSDHLTQGPVVEAFEEAVAKKVGAKHAIAVGSGTAALQIAYQASGFRRLVTSANTFVATASAAVLAGFESAEFKDINIGDGTWIPPLSAQEHTLYVPVHFAGHLAHIPEGIEKQTIEDSCHSMTYSGRTLGACFSFHPVKHITTGEGGMIVTNTLSFARKCRELRDHGRHNGWSEQASINGRLTDFQAALGLSQLSKLDDFLERRKYLSTIYTNHLHGLPLLLPPSNNQPHLYPILTARRDELKTFLHNRGIETAIHYPPVYSHPIYKSPHLSRWYADQWYEQELSLPLYPTLKTKEVMDIISVIHEFFA